jgi:hypothetical protein
MTDEEVETFSRTVDFENLRAYRAAVGRETRAWVMAFDFAELDTSLGQRPVESAVTASGNGRNAGSNGSAEAAAHAQPRGPGRNSDRLIDFDDRRRRPTGRQPGIPTV